MVSKISFLTLLIVSIVQTSHTFQLRSSSTISTNKKVLLGFLATPTHWPEIVLSSNSVKCPSKAKNRINVPLKAGDYVEEVFGLPPILPLSVVWQCIVSDVDEGILEFYSPEGVPGFADECKMIFKIEEKQNNTCDVELVMEFEPRNPIVPLGLPLLSLDNNLALKVLLPKAISMI